MRVLGIVLWTAFGGTLLLVSGNLALLGAAGALRLPDGLVTVLLMLWLPASYVLVAWWATRRSRAKAGPDVPSAAPRRKWIPLAAGIAVPACIVSGIWYLQFRAESQARAFCDTAKTGMPIGPVAANARQTGERLLRRVEAEKVTVGFTGLPPYSRHFCTVEAQAGMITRASYSTLD
jgi:hypothetical protein